MTIDAHQQLRAAKSTPALHALHDWLMQTRMHTADGGGSAKALDYTLRRWPSLIRYAQTDHLPIDNNPVENTIRPIAIGKKNWLFAGSERAGKRAAAIQTLFGTAQLNGFDLVAWLKDTLIELPPCPITVSMNCCRLLRSSLNHLNGMNDRWGRWTHTLRSSIRTLFMASLSSLTT